MRLNDIILQSAKAALDLQSANGSFPKGHNGPYYDPETPVRNTAHWLITLLKAYELSNESTFKDAAFKAAQYLTAPAARPMRATFFCRTNPGKDFCNGLIGQAWAIEALVIASKTLEDHKYQELAKEVFLLHPFDYEVSLWRRVNVDGSHTTYDMTFNHQLWFAAAGAMLDGDKEGKIQRQVARFLDRVQKAHLRTARSGRITHSLRLSSSLRGISGAAAYTLRHPRQVIKQNTKMTHKEIGYHAFNLYGFCLLYQHFPMHPLWQSKKFMPTLRFMNSREYVKGLENNRFGYPYNPPGFEVAFTMQVFGSHLSSVLKPADWWVEQQLKLCYDVREKMMNRNTEDKETLAARLYEATRLQDMKVKIG